MHYFFVLVLLFTFFIPSLVSSTDHMYFSIVCRNRSCEAKAGGIGFAWSGELYTGGILTGVTLPISIEKVNEIAEKANQTVQKVIKTSKTSKVEIKLDQSKNISKSDSVDYFKQYYLSLEKRLGTSIKQDLTLKFFEYYANTSECQVEKLQVRKWMCALANIFNDYRKGKLIALIYGYFLDENLKDIPTEQLEKIVANLPQSEESIDIVNYLIHYRMPLIFGTFSVREDHFTALKAYYADNLLDAFKINEKAAFIRYLVEKGVITIPYSKTQGFLQKYNSYLGDLEESHKGEFYNEIKKMKTLNTVKNVLLIILPFGLVLGLLVFLKRKKGTLKLLKLKDSQNFPSSCDSKT